MLCLMCEHVSCAQSVYVCIVYDESTCTCARRHKHTNTYAHAHMHTQMRILIHRHTYTHTHRYTDAHRYTDRRYTHAHRYTCTDKHTHVHICAHTCMRICTQPTQTHMHTHDAHGCTDKQIHARARSRTCICCVVLPGGRSGVNPTHARGPRNFIWSRLVRTSCGWRTPRVALGHSLYIRRAHTIVRAHSRVPQARPHHTRVTEFVRDFLTIGAGASRHLPTGPETASRDSLSCFVAMIND